MPGISILLLILLMSAASTITTSTTSFFAEASTLPFGTIATTFTSRKHAKTLEDANAGSSGSSFHDRSILGTRAGSTSTRASFVSGLAAGGAAGGLGLESFSYYLRVALAGGVAGMTGSAVLYPIDSAKTLRQSDPRAYSSVKDALLKMLASKNSLQRIYTGILPAAIGAIPSSALYFGAYESSKVALTKMIGDEDGSMDSDYRKRLCVHGLAAASGNVISSFVFVPKEVIKQQLQVQSSRYGGAMATVGSIVKEKGLAGLYTGYGATLLRNIPSATLRFVMYEELKRKLATTTTTTSTMSPDAQQKAQKMRTAGTFLAGALAGSTSSFIMTPIDVVKTRLATGSCPLGVKSCMAYVIKDVGWKGLYAGAGSRVLWSGAFSAIGFTTFELVKGYLGVSTSSSTSSSLSKNYENEAVVSSIPLATTRTFAKSSRAKPQYK